MTHTDHLTFTDDHYFTPDPAQRRIALELYQSVARLPLVCPHGHVDAWLFAQAGYHFDNPAELFIIPDHYVFRMLYSLGVRLEDLGVPRRDGASVETDPRRIWQRFAEHFYLFNGTPTGAWLADELRGVFGVEQKLTGETAGAIYDQVAEQLAAPEFTPRQLYERFNIEVLCTTDGPADRLEAHQAIRASGWRGRIRPTFRPDAVLDLAAPNWLQNVEALGDAAGRAIHDYASFVAALEDRRAFFKAQGAVATDHAAVTPYTAVLAQNELDAIFQRALRGQPEAADAAQFMGHMLVEMARMSVEDGLVMQLHPGALRSHSQAHLERFGPNTGADIPVAVEFTRNLQPLLGRFGHDRRLTLILFTLDETAYGRELAPLAGFYPALRLGPPWWFFDSWNGMRRYFEQVMETAGLYNTAGFNDDTRAFASIPARHDLWRRAAADWLAGLVVRRMLDEDDARGMVHAMAYDLARQAYHLDGAAQAATETRRR
jgi:glucuronate isomerase